MSLYNQLPVIHPDGMTRSMDSRPNRLLRPTVDNVQKTPWCCILQFVLRCTNANMYPMHTCIYIYTCHQCVFALPYIKISILYMVFEHMWSILCCACDAYYHVVVRCMCCQEYVQYKQVQKHKHSIHLCKFRQNVKGIQICNDII